MRTNKTPAEVAAMTDGQVQACGPWPAWFTIEQMRGQLMHEAHGCPPPFPGAVWDGYCYVRGDAVRLADGPALQLLIPGVAPLESKPAQGSLF